MGIKVHAQLDPTLTGMVLIYTEKAKKTLKNQEKVMLLQTTGHIWTKEEVEAVTDLQSCQLCRPDIRLLPRDNALDGEYGRVHRATQKLSDKRLGGCIVHKPE